MIDSYAIKLSNVGIAYAKGMNIFTRKKKWVLNDVSLEIPHGETLGVLGRNGVGKSTLLQLLAGMIVPDKGNIDFKVNRVSLLALQVGFLAHLSGRDNVILSAMFLGMSKNKILKKMDEVIEFSGLGEHIDQPVSIYSSGMRARLGFSVAFHVDADVILVDEVIAVGDAEFKQVARKAMRDKVSSGKTAVIVSHDFALLRQWCDRLMWLDQGSVLMIGKPDAVIQAYRNKLGV